MVVGGRHLTLLIFSENIHFLMNEVLEHSTDDEKLYCVINNNLKRFSAFANIFFGTVLLTVTGLFFLPIISSTKMLPYKIWFPFDINKNIIVLILSKAYAVICMALFAISTLSTLFIWYLMLNVSIRYKTFGSHLKSLNKIKCKGHDGSKKLIEVVEMHLRIRK